jgi:hypothetical protein
VFGEMFKWVWHHGRNVLSRRDLPSRYSTDL